MDNPGLSIISSNAISMDVDEFEYYNVPKNGRESPIRRENNATSTNGDASNTTTSVTDATKDSADPQKSGDAQAGLSQAKRDSSTVDFALPNRGDGVRERFKSISEGPYRGMGKEELLRFSSKPLWRNLRYVCMSIVLTGWLALLITVVALVLTYPSCRQAQETDWWQKAVIYRVYVRSFLDAHKSDGIGDLQGVLNKLDYIESTGASTISLSPIYKLSKNASSDTHIVSHVEIDPVFGDLDLFRRLVNETHTRGMHITMDFIPNHTADEHPWFLASKSETNVANNWYRSYYVWAQGHGVFSSTRPNNWKSVYGCTAWEETNGTYYLHQFTPSQPDLNLRSDKVKDELLDILKFWLDQGVDGFYIRDTDFLFEDYDLRDDSLVDNHTSELVHCGPAGLAYPYSSYKHEHTRAQDQVFDMLARWRAFLDDYGNVTNSYRVLFADVTGTTSHVMDYYGLFIRDGVDFPLNTFSLDLNISKGGSEVAKMVSNWLTNMPSGRWPNWMGGDDRSPRLADRLCERTARSYLILSMLLPGTPFYYYGDEIGMRALSELPEDASPWDMRMPMRGLMMWTNKTYQGFCHDNCNTPWIVPATDHYTSTESQIANPDSIWHLFRNLTSLRKDNPSFHYGDYIPALQDEEVFSFVREYDGETGYLIALNCVDKEVNKYLTGVVSSIPGGGRVEVVSSPHGRHVQGAGASLDPLTLAPYEGVVVSWDYQAKEL